MAPVLINGRDEDSQVGDRKGEHVLLQYLHRVSLPSVVSRQPAGKTSARQE